MPPSQKVLAWAPTLLLVGLTLLVYLPMKDHGFVGYDDNLYVSQNSRVQSGLHWDNILWAFQATDVANWHPLTWLSHMVDCGLFGLKPGGHHLTSLAIHLLNILLLFRVLRLMTGIVWRSAAVAALFAIHPLNVDSVAWIAERKNVLSTLFGFLTLWAYFRYVQRPSWKRYLPVGAFLILGLMAKPMLVTLPFVLLLLDFWPLNRLAKEKKPFRSASCKTKNVGGRSRASGVSHAKEDSLSSLSQLPGWRRVTGILVEKIPLFLIVALSSLVTYVAQRKGGAMTFFDYIPFGARLSNACISYLKYIQRMFWPTGLSVFYPHPGNTVSFVGAVVAIALLSGVSLAVAWQAKKRSYLIVGWLWYLGTLVPVIGLIQVGNQGWC